MRYNPVARPVMGDAVVNLESFLQAMRDDPDDLAMRLVFADWLDDNGDPERAELIRLQCTAPPRPAWDDDALPPVGELSGLTWLSIWAQGFPFGIKDYLARLPQMRRLELSGISYWDEVPAMLSALPRLDHLRWVESWLMPDEVRALM